MPRKSKYEGGTKNKLVEVATKLFFEKGFDGTSVREIVRAAGCEVGLFYYYYKTKDDLFGDVLDNFFAPYKKDFENLVLQAKENHERALFRFFAYVKKEVRNFRKKYSENMHRTVIWAIRERTLTLIEPYIEKILEILIENGAKPIMSPQIAAVFIAHGVGSTILHEDADWTDEATDGIRKAVNLITGLSKEDAQNMFGEKKNKIAEK